ncbi:MAG TPA: NAD(P)-dependent oxidoreductase [Burkholderiales bacterium]|nr:NAD(P)-dependent oxidoreductase [Burkholderiales bacterium]
MRRSVGVIGLGIMGSAISANLVRAGFATFGYDVLQARNKALHRSGGIPLRSPAEVATHAPIVLTSIPSSAALKDVACELSATGKRGTIVVETSTLPIEDKQRARDVLAVAGITLLDCPLSGTGAQAKTGDLSVYASGPRKAYRAATPVFEGFARSHYYLGAFGNGSKMKFVANLLVAIHNVSAAEAFVLGMKAGLPPGLIYKVAGDGAGTSRMFQVRGPMMVAGRYRKATMRNSMWQKDMKIIGDFAARLGVPTPLFRAADRVYAAAMKQGFGAQDTAAVCAVLESMARINRRNT